MPVQRRTLMLRCSWAMLQEQLLLSVLPERTAVPSESRRRHRHRRRELPETMRHRRQRRELLETL